MRFSASREAADEMVQEGRVDKNSHYAGATIVPLNQWSLHRFVESETGDPIQDDSIQSMTKAEMRERDEQMKSIEDADIDTVGDMESRMNRLAESVQLMQKQIEKRDDTILAQSQQLEAEKERAATLGEKPKQPAPAKK